MSPPRFVRRTIFRILVSALVAFVLVAVVGLLAERRRFGADAAQARARIEADVRAQFAALASRLEAAVAALTATPPAVPPDPSADANSVRAWFDRLAAAEANAGLEGVALTVFDARGQPIAWEGRPGEVPQGRREGPPSLFLAPSPLGLRLVRIEPLMDSAEQTRRAGTVAAEATLPRANQPADDNDGFILNTSVVPVELRPRFEGAPSSGDTIMLPSPTGEPLGTIEIADEAIQAARQTFRRRLLAIELGVACTLLLLLVGPLADWRRLVRSPAPHIALTLTMLALLGLARAVAWTALDRAGLGALPLGAPAGLAGVSWLLLASPLDFLLTSLGIAGAVAIVASAYEQWRQGRWLPVQVVPSGSPVRGAVFAAAQVAAGAVAGSLVVAYVTFLATKLSQAPVDILHFALHPWDPERVSLTVGLVVLHAAALATAVLVMRLGSAPWIIPSANRGWRLLVPLLWLAGGLSAATVIRLRGEPVAFAPTALALAFVAAAAWTLGRYRAALRHASQAARLTALFLLLALPAIVFYPALVDAAERARRQLVETRYAPEVVNQRRDLQLHVAQALREIDAVGGLDDLIESAEPVPAGALPSEAAFLVWSQTTLSDQRLTSSVELYDAKGAIVSRFALKLPEPTGATSQETSCTWEVFEEVSPFFAEERRLLHAGRGVCRPGPDGRPTMVGAIAVHVMLDYSNLSFISAQSPYVALLRSSGGETPEPTPREDVEFIVYGWSRAPLYMSGRDAWPLTGAIFQRAYASRGPFWAEVTRADTTYEVYFLNDRAGIYALGYPRPSAFGHLITLAELITLAGATFLALLGGGVVYGRVTARTPASGRGLLREVRASFYRKLFLAFVLAGVVPVLALAFVTRAYIAALMLANIEMEAVRTAASASRVVEDFGSLQLRGTTAPVVDDSLVVWLSRVIAQDVNIFDGPDLLASSERNLFASGLLPTRTAGDVYRAIMLDARPSYVGQETVGGYPYLVAAAPVRVQNREAILTVPFTLRQQEIEAQIDDLDRRVLLATLAFILVGAGIGYYMAERIADPVNRLTRATQRIARGDLDARIIATSSDELRRLVEAFNRMAADLQRQRTELERSNRLAAWADMARQVAHDIKNPLTPIQLNAEHLSRVHTDRGRPLGPVLEECVANILKQVRLLRQIASEFSSFASSPSPRPAPTSLNSLVEEVVEPYRTGLAGRVTIDVNVPPGLPDVVVDRTLLGRAVTNIIENALHAMPADGRLSIEAALEPPSTVRLSISDTGVGMMPESFARIFEPYFSTKASGTGLGLTIAKRNVELNDGRIAVESAPGAGTTVTIRLPSQSQPG